MALTQQLNSALILWGRQACKIKPYLSILLINWHIRIRILYLVVSTLVILALK